MSHSDGADTGVSLPHANPLGDVTLAAGTAIETEHGKVELPPMPTHTKEQLPSEEDRRKMFLCVMAAASSAVEITNAVSAAGKAPPDAAVPSFEEQTDTPSPDSRSTQPTIPDSRTRSAKQDLVAAERHRQRIRSVLTDDLAAAASSSLLLVPPAANEDKPIVSKDEKLLLPVDAFECVTLLLFNLILLCGDSGYDARVRNVVKSAAVHVLSRRMEEEGLHDNVVEELVEAESTPPASTEGVTNIERGEETAEEYGLTPTLLEQYLEVSYQEEIAETGTGEITTRDAAKEGTELMRQQHYLRMATRKFEVMESAITKQLLIAAVGQNKLVGDKNPTTASKTPASSYSKQDIVRGLKIGSAGLLAGALFAVTGGLAAPGIAAGITALGVASTSAAIVTLTSQTALVAIFGLGGGGLAAYKMKRRTEGLSEFRIRKEKNTVESNEDEPAMRNAELRSTVCVSGWLDDTFDFQRPWGVVPTDPPITALELLQRFFAIHDPDKISQCASLLESHKGKKVVLWSELQEKYGRDPDHLLPLAGVAEKLSVEELGIIEQMSQLVLKATPKKSTGAEGGGIPCQQERTGIKERHMEASVQTSSRNDKPVSLMNKEQCTTIHSDKDDLQKKTFASPVATSLAGIPVSFQKCRVVWDLKSQYGGDLYSITWESALLLKLCNYTNDLVKKLTKKATKYVLKQTALATLMAAVAWPSTLLSFADLIDGPWTLATIRADEAGVELARSLIESPEKRPVTLIGFSMGARVIYSCLKELAYHQEIWENQRGNGFPAKASGSDISGGLDAGSAKGNDHEHASNIDTAGDGDVEQDGTFMEEILHQLDDERLAVTDHRNASEISSLLGEFYSGLEAEKVDTSDFGDASQVSTWLREISSGLDAERETAACKDSARKGNNYAVQYLREPASIVEDVVLMGAPIFINRQSWSACRRVVAGRLVNCYSRKDWILSLMFQY